MLENMFLAYFLKIDMFKNSAFQHKIEQLTEILTIFVKNNDYEHINYHLNCSQFRRISD